jgi:hypothetical protein
MSKKNETYAVYMAAQERLWAADELYTQTSVALDEATEANEKASRAYRAAHMALCAAHKKHMDACEKEGS